MLPTALLATLLAVPLPTVSTAQPPAPPPWTVPSPVRIVRQELSFTHSGATLSGTLVRPDDGRRHPVLIALHGAQAPLRSEPLYRHLEQLPALGIAVFLYDRRGSGRSTSGGAAPGNFDLLAADAAAALARLAREPSVDPARIGFWGLSQGGWLAMLAAAKAPRAAFAVAISAPITSADVQMNFAVANILRVQGEPQARIDRAIRARTTVDDYVRGRRTRAEAEAAEADMRAAGLYDRIWIRGNIDDPEWHRQITLDPMRALEGSRVPTLVVFGQGDPWVPVATSLAALGERAVRLPQVTVRVIDGADHAMMLGVPAARQMDAAFAARVAPDAPGYFMLLGSWLERIVHP